MYYTTDMNTELAQKIEQMAKTDQEMREKVRLGGTWDPSSWDTSIDKLHTDELKKIIDTHGWPTIDMVGKQASSNAWLLAQHADHDLPFQKIVLSLLIKAHKNKPDSINPSNIAYLTDRVLAAEGKEQEFGTQFIITDTGLELKPTRDRNTLNARRAQYGLDPVEQYIEESRNYFKK